MLSPPFAAGILRDDSDAAESKAGNVERAEQRDAMIRRRISGLRRRRLRPVGLEPDAPRLTPVSIGEEVMQAGVVSGLRAILTRSPLPLDSISLVYGDFFDLSAPLAEVTTHFHGYGWPSGAPPSDRPASAWELGRAERRDAAIARGAWTALSADQESEPDGPFTQGSRDIVVCGARRNVPMVSYRHYHALSFRAGTGGATVVSRNQLPDLPRFDWVTDLEPYFVGWTRRLSELAERIEPLMT
jgi:hypothetical protein